MTTLIDQPTRTHIIILPLVHRTTYLRRSAHSAVLLFAWFAEHVLDDLHCCACYAHELLFPALQQQSGRGLHPATFRRHECLDSRDTASKFQSLTFTYLFCLWMGPLSCVHSEEPPNSFALSRSLTIKPA